jgi:hypothetical protein
MSGGEDYPLDDETKALNAAIEARLTAFDQRKDEILRHLQEVCERRPKTKSFDPGTAWRHIRMHAWSYLQNAVRREMAPNFGWVKELRHLENLLKEARCVFGKVRGPVFVEWCETHGNPDFTDPIIEVYADRFDELLLGMETAASRAAEQMRRKPGAPRGASEQQIELIVNLEHAYQSITGKSGGAGCGPFARFVKDFFGALGRATTEGNVVQLIRAARKTPRWGRSFLTRSLSR